MVNASPLPATGYVLIDATQFSAGRNRSLLVASNGASALIKAQADYVCDGVNDEVQIAAALAAVPAGGGEVQLSAGTFNIGAVNLINIPKNTTLSGAGGGLWGSDAATMLNYDGSAGAAPSGANGYLISAMVLIKGTSSLVRVNGQQIRDIGFGGNGIANITGLHINYSNVWHLDNLRFWDCKQFGIYILGGSDGTIRRTRFEYCGSDDGLATGQYRGALELNDDIGDWANDNIVIDACWWEMCKDRAVTIRRTSGIGDTNTNRDDVPYAITLINCKFENGNTSPRGGPNNSYIKISGNGLRVINCFFFMGNMTADSSANRMAAAIHANNYYGVWIKDNQFVMNSTFTEVAIEAWILLDNGEGAIVSGNRFEGSKGPSTAQIRWINSNTRAISSGNYYSPNHEAVYGARTFTSGAPTNYARSQKVTVTTTTSTATPTFDTDYVSVYGLTLLAVNTDFSTVGHTGTPVNGDEFRIYIVADGTTRTLTWGAKFESSTVTLPADTALFLSARRDFHFVWNSVASKWRLQAAV